MKKYILIIALFFLSNVSLFAQEGKTYKSLEEALKHPTWYLVWTLEIKI